MTTDYEPAEQDAPHNQPIMEPPSFENEDIDKTRLPISSNNKSSSRQKKQKTAVQKLFDISQLKIVGFYQSLFSEFLGTMILTIVCTATGLPITSKPVIDLNGALASGLIVSTIVIGFGHVSGAHINPAVTLSFLVTGEIDFIRAIAYVIMQLIGATCGSALVKAITPSNTQAKLGMTLITEGVSPTQAFTVEFIITFILCYTVHAICDKNRNDIGGSKALAVGFAVTIGCLFGGPYTGAAMNPARSFGPAFVANFWKNHWIYWYGPLAGATMAALVYTRVLKKKASASTSSEHPSSAPINSSEY